MNYIKRVVLCGNNYASPQNHPLLSVLQLLLSKREIELQIHKNVVFYWWRNKIFTSKNTLGYILFSFVVVGVRRQKSIGALPILSFLPLISPLVQCHYQHQPNHYIRENKRASPSLCCVLVQYVYRTVPSPATRPPTSPHYDPKQEYYLNFTVRANSTSKHLLYLV